MKRIWSWVAIILIASLLVAALLEYTRGTASLTTRLQTSLKQAKQNYRAYAPAPHSVQAVVLHRLVDHLKRATPRSLQTPTLVIAYVVDQQNGSPRKLAVTWIAARPQAKSVLLQPADQHAKPVSLPIPQAQQDDNQKQARDKVVFSVIIPLVAASPAAKLLQHAGTSPDHPTVRLQCHGSPCSNAQPCFLAQKGELPTQ